jgi:hypothetical protein
MFCELYVLCSSILPTSPTLRLLLGYSVVGHEIRSREKISYAACGAL